MKLMIKGNKLIISTSLFFFFALCSTKAQVRLYEDSIFRAQDTVGEIIELLYNRVYKNIASFNIKYANFRMNGSTPADMFRSDADLDYSYGCFLPDEGYKLKMVIKDTILPYPDSRYKIYAITINRFEYIPTDKHKPTYSCNGPRTTKNFLIAVNAQSMEVKFISGQFFLSDIAKDFKLNPEDPSSYLSYLSLRAFRYQVSNIKYEERAKDSLIYRGYSEYTNSEVTIKLSTMNNEIVSIQAIKPTSTQKVAFNENPGQKKQ
jgi:hypothetical protein